MTQINGFFLNLGDSNLNPNLNLQSQDCKKYHITALCMGIAGAGWYKKEVAHRLAKVALTVLIVTYEIAITMDISNLEGWDINDFYLLKSLL